MRILTRVKSRMQDLLKNSTTTLINSLISTLSARLYSKFTQDSSKYNLEVAVAFERTSLGLPSYVTYLKKDSNTWLRVTQYLSFNQVHLRKDKHRRGIGPAQRQNGNLPARDKEQRCISKPTQPCSEPAASIRGMLSAAVLLHRKAEHTRNDTISRLETDSLSAQTTASQLLRRIPGKAVQKSSVCQ